MKEDKLGEAPMDVDLKNIGENPREKEAKPGENGRNRRRMMVWMRRGREMADYARIGRGLEEHG